jgi:hypothetical protein
MGDIRSMREQKIRDINAFGRKHTLTVGGKGSCDVRLLTMQMELNATLCQDYEFFLGRYFSEDRDSNVHIAIPPPNQVSMSGLEDIVSITVSGNGEDSHPPGFSLQRDPLKLTLDSELKNAMVFLREGLFFYAGYNGQGRNFVPPIYKITLRADDLTAGSGNGIPLTIQEGMLPVRFTMEQSGNEECVRSYFNREVVPLLEEKNPDGNTIYVDPVEKMYALFRLYMGLLSQRYDGSDEQNAANAVLRILLMIQNAERNRTMACRGYGANGGTVLNTAQEIEMQVAYECLTGKDAFTRAYAACHGLKPGSAVDILVPVESHQRKIIASSGALDRYRETML